MGAHFRDAPHEEQKMSGFFGHDKSELTDSPHETIEQQQERIRAESEKWREQQAKRKAAEAEVQAFCAFLRGRHGCTDVRWKDGEGWQRTWPDGANWYSTLTVVAVGRELTFEVTEENVDALARAGLRPNEWMTATQTARLHKLAEAGLVAAPGGGFVDGETATAMGTTIPEAGGVS